MRVHTSLATEVGRRRRGGGGRGREGVAQRLLEELLEGAGVDTGPDNSDVALAKDGLGVRLDVFRGNVVAGGCEDGVSEPRAEGEGMCSLKGTGSRVGGGGSALGFTGGANQLVKLVPSELS